jgi:hypothetical protein
MGGRPINATPKRRLTWLSTNKFGGSIFASIRKLRTDVATAGPLTAARHGREGTAVHEMARFNAGTRFAAGARARLATAVVRIRAWAWLERPRV